MTFDGPLIPKEPHDDPVPLRAGLLSPVSSMRGSVSEKPELGLRRLLSANRCANKTPFSKRPGTDAKEVPGSTSPPRGMM